MISKTQQFLISFLKNIDARQATIFCLLVALGVAGRFFIETPNLKPIAAFAMFGGFFFRRWSVALAYVLVVMLISDFWLGAYSLPLMIAVYGSLAISVGLGYWIKSNSVSNEANSIGTNVGSSELLRFVSGSLVMSTAFYLLTNGAVWMMGRWYSQSWMGLMECLAAGLPFYRFTLAGDLLFTSLTITSFVLFNKACEAIDRTTMARQA